MCEVRYYLHKRNRPALTNRRRRPPKRAAA
jgi:hypothetical protein